MAGPAKTVAIVGVPVRVIMIIRFLKDVMSAMIMLMTYNKPMCPTQYKVCAAAYVSTFSQVAFMIKPTTMMRSMTRKPSIRPQMSMILAIVKEEVPPRIEETILIVARRPCWPNEEVTYGLRFVWIETSSMSTKETR